jgi:NAD(P)H-dependent flavin oxidoreductase YrpB (nitropropane dioxygenase family)
LALVTQLTELMAIKHPIVLAPMGAVAGGCLAAAVTRAGGLGMLGPGYADSAWIEREFDAAKGERIGIGFIAWDLARDSRRLDVALKRGPAAIMFSFGIRARSWARYGVPGPNCLCRFRRCRQPGRRRSLVPTSSSRREPKREAAGRLVASSRFCPLSLTQFIRYRLSRPAVSATDGDWPRL